MTPEERALALWRLLEYDQYLSIRHRELFVRTLAAFIAGAETEAMERMQRKCERVAALSSRAAAIAIRDLEVDG